MRGVRFLAPSAAIAALALLAVGGCSSGGSTSGPAKASASSPSSPVGQTYASKAFAVPLTITVPASFFKAQPNSDTSTFLTWFTGSEARFHKVRFLLPDALYRPGQTQGPGKVVKHAPMSGSFSRPQVRLSLVSGLGRAAETEGGDRTIRTVIDLPGPWGSHETMLSKHRTG